MFPFMSCFRSGNRHYWQLPDGLPIGAETVSKNFLFRNESWSYFARFEDRGEGEMLWITLSCTSDIVASFDVKFGISENFRIHIESKMLGSNKTSPYFGEIQINRSELVDLIELKCLVHFFIDITEESNEETSKREDERKTLKMKANKRKLEKDYEDLLLNGVHSDVTVDVKHKKFKCHRGILSVRSPVFSAMLEHDMKEKASGVVRIEDAEPTSFQDFLIYLYTGSSDNLNWENVTELYKLGDKYSVGDLKKLCVEQMKRDISIQNFCEFFLLSQQRNDSELAEMAIQFFSEKWEEIMENECWLTLLSENPVESTVLLKAFGKNKK